MPPAPRGAGGQPGRGLLRDARRYLRGRRQAGADLRPATATELQAAPDDWRGGPATRQRRCLAGRGDRRPAGDRRPGRGPGDPAGRRSPSHFDHFFRIYSAFPNRDAVADATGRQQPEHAVRPVRRRRPRAGPHHPPDDQALGAPVQRSLPHVATGPRARAAPAGPMQDPDTGAPTSRARLRDWTFQEMRGVGGIAQLLTTRP